MVLLLKDKISVVTGAASGIGAAISERLAFHGSGVALLDINEEGLALVKKNIEKLYDVPIFIFPVDVTNYDALMKTGEKIVEVFSKIDVLVNCAGGGKIPMGFRDHDAESWKKQIDLNMNSVFYCCKMVMEQMISQRSGKIINISSVAGLIGGGLLGRSAYATAKAGVAGMTKALARELGEFGIHVNTIAPGLHVTPLTSVHGDDFINSVKEKLILKTSGEPEKLGELVAFLASENAQFITGSMIVVDGGLAMH